MTLRSKWKVQTIAVAYQNICQGALPWVALGNFMNEWFDYSINERESLIHDPLLIPEETTKETIQWAAFCAASVEYLCEKYQVACPSWVEKPEYILSEPWFAYDVPGLVNPRVREYFLTTTPPAFQRRNIFCGDRVFANKYEFAQSYQER
jgi:hypothetical protein